MFRDGEAVICSGLDVKGRAGGVEKSEGFKGRGGTLGFGYVMLKLCRGVFVLGGVSLLRMRDHQNNSAGIKKSTHNLLFKEVILGACESSSISSFKLVSEPAPFLDGGRELEARMDAGGAGTGLNKGETAGEEPLELI